MSIIDDLRNARIAPGDEGAQEQLIYLHHGILEQLANSSVSAAQLATIARLTALRAVSGTTSTLAITDRILKVNASAEHTTTLPSAASAVNMDFLVQRVDTNAVALILALNAGDTGSKIYFQNNTPVAGASLSLTGSDSGNRPGFLIYSDGTNWWVV